ncbi:MAG: hypothetical protein ACJ798_15595 [Phenylobacterium sp.]
MNKSLLIAALLLIAAPVAAKTPAHHAPAPPPPPFDFGGGWDSNLGDLRVEQEGSHFTATYPSSHGRLSAEVKGNVAEGYWAQSTGSQRCDTMKLDSPYWGRIEMIAQPGGHRFEGSWSYCGGSPNISVEGKRR